MLTRLRTHFGTAGLVVAVVALVAAIGGTALAASGALTGKQKKEVTKIAKKYAGKPGAAGPAGPAGSSGKDGAQGAKGEKGDTGAQGVQGVQGVQGKEGKQGKEGSPWTAGGVLPTGESEYGHWAYGMTGTEESLATAPISFVIPTDEKPTLHYVTFGSTDPECPGSPSEPAASAGNLCVFEGEPQLSTGELFPGATEFTLDQNGVVLFFTTPTGDDPNVRVPSLAYGTWAVTAE
jgi:hypothetical protein